LGKLAVVALIAAAFLTGLVLTVYLSLRSPEIQVPDVVNKTYLEGQAALAQNGLDIRERAKRFKVGVQPGVILDQSPRAGEVVKEGQTIAVVVSRAPKEGEEALAAQAEEARREEEAARAKEQGSNANSNTADPAASANRNDNQNRERRRNANRNANANLNGNRNAAPGVNAGNVNNRNAGRNDNRNAARPANPNVNRSAPAPRNANTARPAGANANRRPSP
jgi:hypothetical protein